MEKSRFVWEGPANKYRAKSAVTQSTPPTLVHPTVLDNNCTIFLGGNLEIKPNHLISCDLQWWRNTQYLVTAGLITSSWCQLYQESNVTPDITGLWCCKPSAQLQHMLSMLCKICSYIWNFLNGTSASSLAILSAAHTAKF